MAPTSTLQRPMAGRWAAASRIARGAHSTTWGLHPRGTRLPGLEVGSRRHVGERAPLPLDSGLPMPSQRASCLQKTEDSLLPYGQMHCSCTTDGGSPNHLPMALLPPPPCLACPPDFMATAMQDCSCMFAIRAGLLLVHGAHGGAALTGSYSASKGFGRQGWQVVPAGRVGRGATPLRVDQTRCGNGGESVGHGAMPPRVG